VIVITITIDSIVFIMWAISLRQQITASTCF
jgi:hypothetical protein